MSIFRTVQPASYDRCVLPAIMLSVVGIGRNLDALRRDGHTNPGVGFYDQKRHNSTVAAVFTGDVTIFVKSTGWFTLRDGRGDTFTFHPDSQVTVTDNGGVATCTLRELYIYL